MISGWPWRDCTGPALGCPWHEAVRRLLSFFADFVKKHNVLVSFLLAGVEHPTEAAEWIKALP